MTTTFPHARIDQQPATVIDGAGRRTLAAFVAVHYDGSQCAFVYDDNDPVATFAAFKDATQWLEVRFRVIDAEQRLDEACLDFNHGKPSLDDVRRMAQDIAFDLGLRVEWDAEGNPAFRDLQAD